MSEAAKFLEALFGGDHGCYILLWTLGDKCSYWFSDLGCAARFVDLRADEDVYVGVALSREKHGPHHRLTLTGERPPAGIIGLWADIDIAGEGQAKPNLPPSEEDALKIPPDDLRPTVVVHSGHGLQCWWLFKEPWIFDSPEDLERAASLEARWLGLLKQRAAAHGWTIDAVQDLTRILRVPGTTNTKVPGKPVPVTIRWLDEQPEARYNPSDLAEALECTPVAARAPEVGQQARPASAPHTECEAFRVNMSDADLIEKALAAANGAKFRALFDRGDLAAYNGDSSAADMALANLLAFWTRKDAERMDRLFRRSALFRPKWDERRGATTYGERTIAEAIAHTTEVYSPGAPRAEAEDAGLRHFPFTDAGNGERLVKIHGRNIRYCHPTKTWYCWDGRLWTPDSNGRLMDFAKDIARHLYHEAAEIEDSAQRAPCAKWARQSESTEKRRAAIIAAQSEPGIPVQMSDFDTDPWLLCCLNGVLDLRTGALQPHRREDYITRMAPVEYDPEARCEEWERFLGETCGGNEEFVRFLQEAVGYSLTGDTREEKLFFVHGAGATGKSTFLEAVKATLGSYAKVADFDSFVQRREAGGVRDDIAELAGRRFIVSIEVDEGRKLAEGLVKQLTGRDTIRARFLYQGGFEFVPQGKFWLAANSAPRVRDNDAALWRRILRIPFDRVVPEDRRDPTLKARLRDTSVSGPGILAWAVKGCLRWQREGLRVPDLVKVATEEYREEMDPLKDFLADCCVLNENAWVPSADLYKHYEAWTRENRVQFPLDAKGLAERLRAHGCKDERKYVAGKQCRIWCGVGLRTQEE
jgi:putative DNA primase/helicase